MTVLSVPAGLPLAVSPPTVRVDVVTDESRLPELAREWASLLAETPEWSGFQSLAWIMACRRVLATEASSLFVLRFRQGHETIGLMPTELGPGGELRFIGDGVTNYCGPLYRPERLAGMMRALRTFLTADDRLLLTDWSGLRARSPAAAALLALDVPGWAPARGLQIADCPGVDLHGGWSAVYAQRRSNFRSSVSRKWAALQRLGPLEFSEVTDPGEARDLLPSLFALFRERWTGRHESGGFAGRNRRFHEAAVPALAAAGHLRVSVLRIAGEVAAFAYGVRGARGTSSYVIGHANALAHHSPGQALLVRLLEAACARGDTEYDFSTGDESYKRIWATDSDPLLRVLMARQRPAARARAGWRRVRVASWVGVRSVSWLRDVRRDGLVRLITRRPRRLLADTPGLAAGRDGVWRVHRVSPLPVDAGIAVDTWDWVAMRRRLSPRLLEHAAERSFRSDGLVVLARGERLLGILWRARDDRRRHLVTGGHAAAAVYYHPVTAPGVATRELIDGLRTTLDADQPALVVATSVLRGDGVEPLATFAADHAFHELAGPAARLRARLTRGGRP